MNRQPITITAEDAARKIKPESRLFLTGNCSTPQEFIAALCSRAHELHGVELIQVLSLGKSDYDWQRLAPYIRVNNLFIGASMREAVNQGWADFTPVFLSEIPGLF